MTDTVIIYKGVGVVPGAITLTGLAADTLRGDGTCAPPTGFATSAQGALAATAVQPAGLTKAAVGLGNADNTTDAGKPVSTATQTALDGKQVAGSYATGSGSASGTNTGDNATNTQYSGLAASKQDTLVSGTNIKTVNGASVLGSGDLVVSGAFGMTQAIVSLPYPAQTNHRVTVTDAAVSPTSKIILSLAGVPDTAENTGDFCDLLSMQGVAGSGSFQLQANFLTPIGGALTITYAIGA